MSGAAECLKEKKKKKPRSGRPQMKIQLSNKTCVGSPADQGLDSSQCQRGVLGRSLEGNSGVGNAALPFSNLPQASGLQAAVIGA